MVHFTCAAPVGTANDQAVWKKEYISGFGQVLAERSIASNTMILMSGARATGATVVPFSVGTGLPTGTTLAVDIRTDAGPWAHLTGVAVNAQGQFSIADSNFATGESSFVRVKRENQPDAAYSQPIALVVDPSVTSSSASTINHISISRVGTDLKLRWSLAANNNKPFKILFRRADNNTELDLTPMGLPANSRELSLGSQSQNLPAGNFLAHQVLGTVDQGGLGGHFEDGTIPPPASTGPVYITQYHHRDHLGTLRLITDEMGGLIEAHDYEPFGVELNPPFGAASRKKYTGHERDESTGLDYMLARYYPSTMGRFLSVDPVSAPKVGVAISWNGFSYVRCNPVSSLDPNGLEERSSGNPSASRRVLVFFGFDKVESTGTNSAVGNGAPPPDVLSLTGNSSTFVQVRTGEHFNDDSLSSALSEGSGTTVVVISHSVGPLGRPTGIASFGFEGDGFSPTEVSAGTVGIFSCASSQLSGYSGAGNLVTMDSGPDGQTSSPALTRAGYAFAKATIAGASPAEATSQANSALKPPPILNNNKLVQQKQNPVDKGDKVKIKKPEEGR